MSKACEIGPRFWSKVSRDGPPHPYRPELGSCWLWTAHSQRYGKFKVGGKYGTVAQAHRIAYALEVGEPGALRVCHSCDRMLCVNPTHLFLGTDLDNARDRHLKGRSHLPRGQTLTASDVVAIRAHRGWLSQSHLAGLFGVTNRTISDVQRGRSWKHV